MRKIIAPSLLYFFMLFFSSELMANHVPYELHKVIAGHRGNVNSVAFSPDDYEMLISGGDDNTVRFYNPMTGLNVRHHTMHTSAVRSIVFSPAGNWFSWGTANGETYFGSLTDETLSSYQDPGQHDSVRDNAVSATGKVAVANGINSVLKIWNPSTAEHDNLYTGDSEINAVAFHPQTEELVLGKSDGVVKYYEKISHYCGYQFLRTSGATVTSVAFSRDGKLVAWGDADGKVEIYNFATNQITPLQAKGSSVNTVIFSPVENLLAVGTADGFIQFWNSDSFQIVQEIAAHAGPVNSLAFSSEGYLLASAGNPEIKIWRRKN